MSFEEAIGVSFEEALANAMDDAAEIQVGAEYDPDQPFDTAAAVPANHAATAFDEATACSSAAAADSCMGPAMTDPATAAATTLEEPLAQAAGGWAAARPASMVAAGDL